MRNRNVKKYKPTLFASAQWSMSKTIWEYDRKAELKKTFLIPEDIELVEDGRYFHDLRRVYIKE